MSRKTRNLLTLGIISIVLFCCALIGISRTQKVAETQDALPQGQPSIGGPFELIDKDGKTWKSSDFKGTPLLIYFGYTYCPDICPTALYTMSQAIEKLGGKSVVHPLFITIDPERDTPAQLGNYFQNFLKEFIMLTGSSSQIKQAIKAFCVHAARVEEGRGEGDYLMDHSSLIYLMDKEGKYIAHFDHKCSPQDIIKRVKTYLKTEK